MSRQERSIIIGLVLVGALLYAFNMENVLFWDDADWITNNPRVQELSIDNLSFVFSHDVLAGIGQSSNYYRPFLMLTFAFNWALGGATPWGYHLVSNALHIANAILIFLLLCRLLARVPEDRKSVSNTFHFSLSTRHSTAVAALAAVLWLIHPLQTEAVTYISGRGDPLSVFLMLSAILLWLRAPHVKKGGDMSRAEVNGDARAGFGRASSSQEAADRRSPPTSGRASAYLRLLAIISAILAIFSRETAVLLPLYLTVILIAFRYAALPLFRSCALSLRDSWPFYLVSAVYGILRLTVLDFANTLNWYGASNAYTEHISYRIYTFLEALWVYARLIVAPVGLHMERNVPVLTSLFQWPAWAGALLVIVFLASVVWFWRRGNRIWFFAVGMFFIPLVPSSGILVPINSLIYEHWLYLSLLGAVTLVAVYGVRLYDWLAASKKAELRMAKYALLALVISHLSFLTIQTVRRNIIWGSPEKLYRQILQYERQNVRVLNNLANLYADQKKMENAERYWLAAIEADPTQPAPYHNLGNLERDRGNIEKAVVWYEKAIEVRPSFWYPYQNLTAMLLGAGRKSEAIPVLIAWQKADPQQPLTYYVLAQLFAEGGKRTEARAILEKGYPTAKAAGPEFEQAFAQLLLKLQ